VNERERTDHSVVAARHEVDGHARPGARRVDLVAEAALVAGAEDEAFAARPNRLDRRPGEKKRRERGERDEVVRRHGREAQSEERRASRQLCRKLEMREAREESDANRPGMPPRTRRRTHEAPLLSVSPTPVRPPKLAADQSRGGARGNRVFGFAERVEEWVQRAGGRGGDALSRRGC